MNKVILIGGNHHNGLGLVRSFGVNHIYPYGIIIGEDSKRSFLRYSRYWKKIWTIEDKNKIIEFLLNEFRNEIEKPVIIPWSDTAAKIIDENLNRLKEFFIVPSIRGEQGSIAQLMVKSKQVELANEFGIPMANSCIVELPCCNPPEQINYPCIVKPVVSTEGLKADIRMFDNPMETAEYFSKLTDLGYTRILVQDYINYEYEVGFIGSCSSDPAFLINKKVRIWPKVGGSNSFVQKENDRGVQEMCHSILNVLKHIGYCGMFDVELFCLKDKVYLNEINWRSSGNSFFCLGSEVHYAVIWYYIMSGYDVPSNMKRTNDDSSFYAMNESTDLRHVVYGNLPFLKWNRDRKRCKCFALWYKGDLKPTIVQYCHLFISMIGRKRKDYN